MAASLAPLFKLDLSSPEDYQKRKVALISGRPHARDVVGRA